MPTPIKKFKSLVPSVIWSRGTSYYNYNAVLIEKANLHAGTFLATVSGSDDYTTEMKIQNKEVIDYSCDCPYHYGSICKHIVALFLQIEEDYPVFWNTGSTEEENNEGYDDDDDDDFGDDDFDDDEYEEDPNHKTVGEQIEEIASSLSIEEMRHFIWVNCLANVPLRKVFFEEFGDRISSGIPNLTKNDSTANTEISFYKSDVQDSLVSLETYMEEDAETDYHGKDFFFGIDSFIDNMEGSVEKLLDKLHPENTKDIVELLLYTLDQYYIFLDNLEDFKKEMLFDSEATTPIDNALLLVVERISDKDLLLQLFNYAIEHLEQQNTANMLKLATNSLGSPSDFHKLLVKVDNAITQNTNNNLSKTKLECFRYDLLEKYQGTETALSYAKQQLHNEELLSKLITNAIKNDALDEAEKFALKGLENTKFGKRDLYAKLFEIAQKQGNSDNKMRYAEELLFNRYFRDIESRKAYYTTIKECCPKNKWKEKYKSLINIGIKTNIDILAFLYAEEKDWDKLLELLSNSKNLDSLKQYDVHLLQTHRQELGQLYQNLIEDYINKNPNRSTYEEAAQHIKHMINIDLSNFAQNTINYLCTQYKQRRALVDILSKIKN